MSQGHRCHGRQGGGSRGSGGRALATSRSTSEMAQVKSMSKVDDPKVADVAPGKEDEGRTSSALAWLDETPTAPMENVVPLTRLAR